MKNFKVGSGCKENGYNDVVSMNVVIEVVHTFFSDHS